ncbi:C4-dicarboxylate ABC transporter permease [Gammaproteobacteria bacterium]|nr:C4-dicarboxylate ABC transporter permease [Gammaproteobacteria bacterium]
MRLIRQILDFVLSKLTIFIFIVLLFCVIWQVLARWLSITSTFTDEAARFMFIWVGLFGAALGHGQGRHLAIDLFTGKLSGHKKLLSNIIIHLLVIGFSASIMIYGGGMAMLKTQGQLSPVMQIPMWIIYIAIPFNGVAIAFYSFYDLFGLFCNRLISKKEEA